MRQADRRPVRALLLFHGWGGTGEELVRTLQPWTLRWPGIRLVGLEGPGAVDGGGPGRQWFSRIGIDAHNRATRICDARAGVDAAVDAALASVDLEAGDTAWLGFSQGAMVLLDAISQGRYRPRAAVAIAGRLVVEPSARGDTPILLLHGDRDEVVPASHAAAAHAVLARLGYASTVVTVPRVAHQITRVVMDHAARFLDSFAPPRGDRAP